MGNNSLVLCLCIFVTSVRADNPCASFEFPTLNNSALTAKEGEKVTVPFYIMHNNCGKPDKFKVTVSKKVAENIPYDHCDFRLEKGSFVLTLQTSAVCKCSTDQDMTFTKTLDRNDSTTWTWITSDGITRTKIINFTGLYAPPTRQFQLVPVSP
ncbi:hypothetical protein BaRGS_00037679 [Batillaria attramentaria]|uniref:Uncharacterized protein n=1 Tax=Batillaria attramentaria TaxID=370345 RepID=A0ABD0J8I3_9CAEN